MDKQSKTNKLGHRFIYCIKMTSGVKLKRSILSTHWVELSFFIVRGMQTYNKACYYSVTDGGLLELKSSIQVALSISGNKQYELPITTNNTI